MIVKLLSSILKSKKMTLKDIITYCIYNHDLQESSHLVESNFDQALNQNP